jgi:polyisoprenyl-phosphate glycosyltransferase
MHPLPKTIAIVTPVLDDWASFAALTREIASRFTGVGLKLHVYAVDDGSREPSEAAAQVPAPHSSITSIEVIRLAANLGHQRAIAVGLCAVVEDEMADAVLVMDADGQDRPADIEALLAAGAQHPQHVVLAARAKRAEHRAFRLWYWLYRLLFRALTGQAINFGNFCLIPMEAARRLVHMPELWNNLAAAVMRSRLPYLTVPTVRATRSCGNSKMNLPGLIVHGLSAMSVYSDVIFVRVVLGAGGISALAALAIVAVAVIRMATNRAIPGWATTAVGDLMIILLQTLVVAIAASLVMLAGRSSRPLVPIHDCAAFVIGRESRQRNQPRPVISLAARPVA